MFAAVAEAIALPAEQAVQRARIRRQRGRELVAERARFDLRGQRFAHRFLQPRGGLAGGRGERDARRRCAGPVAGELGQQLRHLRGLAGARPAGHQLQMAAGQPRGQRARQPRFVIPVAPQRQRVALEHQHALGRHGARIQRDSARARGDPGRGAQHFQPLAGFGQRRWLALGVDFRKQFRQARQWQARVSVRERAAGQCGRDLHPVGRLVVRVAQAQRQRVVHGAQPAALPQRRQQAHAASRRCSSASSCSTSASGSRNAWMPGAAGSSRSRPRQNR